MSEPFWNFSLQFYAAPSVAESCLELQDRHGADVNLILFALWAASRGSTLDAAAIAAADQQAKPWRETVIKPLRAARRALKQPPDGFDAPAVAALRRNVQAHELEAERLQQAAMASLVPRPAQHPSLAAARAYLALYATLLGASFPSAPVEALLRAFSVRLTAHPSQGSDRHE